MFKTIAIGALALSLLLFIVVNPVVALAVGESCLTPGGTLCWPYCTDSSCSPAGISFDVNQIQARYEEWRDRHIFGHNLPTGDADMLRVWKTDPTSGAQDTTTSEGMAYGMLFAAYFDEQNTFDKLWRYSKSHFHPDGCMNWCVLSDNQLCGSRNCATDAEIDMATALIFACKKVTDGAWGTGAYNYCSEAQALLDTIYDHEVDSQGYLLAGNAFPTLNPSYFDPGFFHMYDQFEGGTRWSKVADRSYQNIDTNQDYHNGCSNLIYNWTNPSGGSGQGGEADIYSFDAVRIPGRIARDLLWFKDARAQETLNEIGGFFRSVGVENIGMKYKMNGEVVHSPVANPSFHQPVFTAMGALAIILADQPIAPQLPCGQASGKTSTPQQAFDESIAVHESNMTYTYFNWSNELWAQMLMTGNMPNLLAAQGADCNNGIQDGTESDVDCGGACTGCAPDRSCNKDQDCQSSICFNNTCQAPTCNDGKQNGQEEGIDCGGNCPACPTCTDSQVNGTETDVDCGGEICPSCQDGLACDSAADCQSGVCSGICQAPQCNDGVQNGDEAGVDCGGSCPMVCAELHLEYKNESGNIIDQSVRPILRVVNEDAVSYDMTNLDIRYFFVKEGSADLQVHCDYATIQCSNVNLRFVAMDSPTPTADHYLEVSFKGGTLPATGDSGEIKLRFNLSDWSAQDQSNDYSHAAGITAWTQVDNIVLYENGSLVSGIEPN